MVYHSEQIVTPGVNLMSKQSHELKCATGLLSGFSDEDLNHIAEFGTVTLLQEGDVLFTEGEDGDRLFMIISGRVDILKIMGMDHARHTIANVEEGTMLGELSLVDGLPYSATAVAAAPTKVLILSHQNLDNLSSDYPEISLQILNDIAKVMAQRLRSTTNCLVDQYELAMEVGWMAPVKN